MIMINDHDGNGDDATYSEIAYQSSLSRSLAYEPNEQVNVVHTKDYSHHSHAKNNNTFYVCTSLIFLYDLV